MLEWALNSPVTAAVSGRFQADRVDADVVVEMRKLAWTLAESQLRLEAVACEGTVLVPAALQHWTSSCTCCLLQAET